MNPFDVRWLWRAIRGRSVTFALVFFLALVGLSASKAIRSVLEMLSVPWLVAWIAPVIILGILAKQEPKLIPSEKLRSRIALGFIVAGLSFALVVPRILPKEEIPPAETTEEEPPKSPRHLGPPGRS